MVQKGQSGGFNDHMLSFAPDNEAVEGLDRACRLTSGRAEGSEIVQADEQLRCPVHGVSIQIRPDAPHPPSLKSQ